MCFRVLVPKAFPLPISAVFKLVKALIPSSLEIFFFFFSQPRVLGSPPNPLQFLLGHRLSSRSMFGFPFMHLPDSSPATKFRKILGPVNSRNNKPTTHALAGPATAAVCTSQALTDSGFPSKDRRGPCAKEGMETERAQAKWQSRHSNQGFGQQGPLSTPPLYSLILCTPLR